ncbi:hypothetical protein GCM10027172_07600 [Halomonas garicola]
MVIQRVAHLLGLAFVALQAAVHLGQLVLGGFLAVVAFDYLLLLVDAFLQRGRRFVRRQAGEGVKRGVGSVDVVA